MDPMDLGLLLLRVLFGVTFSLHGFQKLFGWFGGGGLGATARWFASLGFGSGRPAAIMAGMSEVGGGLGLALGLMTPLSAMAVIATMTTAAFVNQAEKGFWSAGNGWELNGYLIVIAAAIAVAGPGRLSIDAVVGLDQLVDGWVGVAAILVGLAAGLVRWRTRDDTPLD